MYLKWNIAMTKEGRKNNIPLIKEKKNWLRNNEVNINGVQVVFPLSFETIKNKKLV